MIGPGEVDGDFVVSAADGPGVALAVGFVGLLVGLGVGATVGLADGLADGLTVGLTDGLLDALTVELADGSADGLLVEVVAMGRRRYGHAEGPISGSPAMSVCWVEASTSTKEASWSGGKALKKVKRI